MDVYESMRLSALSKSKHINQYIKNTTIGPNKSRTEIEESVTDDEDKVEEPKTSILLEHNYVATNASSLIRKFISELENLRQGKVQEAVNSRIKQISDFSKQQTLITHQQIARHQQLLMNEIQEKEVLIIRTLEQHDKDMLEQHQQLLQYYKILEEKRKQNTKELEEQQKRRQKMCALFDEIKQNQIQFCSIYQKIISDIKSFPFSSQLRDHLGDLAQQLKTLPDRLEEIIANCKTKAITEADRIKSNRLVEDIKGLQTLVEEKISIINEEQESKAQPPPAVQLHKPDVVRRNSETKTVLTNVKVDQFVSVSSLKVYTELQTYLENYKKRFQALVQNSTLKKFRFDCQKAVNIPVNAISATNQHHLIDKYNRLSTLLSGKRVQIGDDTVCAADHPEGIAFCINLLAKKFVVQGDLMISSNPDAAFCYSSIIIALWNNNPDFGKLLLAQFHTQCPYLVPVFLPRTVEQTDQEFYQSQGYRYIDGVIEKQDKFLKRMTGIMRLYSAIIIAKPRKGQTNPLGTVEGWRWLTSFLNLEPKEDITATLLHIFFEICGSALCNAYGKIFEKLMEYVCGFYLPKIQKIDKGGPVTRLEMILVNYYKSKKFEQPNGVLPANFW